MRRVGQRIVGLLIGLALLLAVPTPGVASPVSLTGIRPAMVFVGTNTEVSLIGSGFGPTCTVSVRAPDISERTTPAVLRSGTEMTVLVGGELTARARTLEFQVRCTIETDMVTRTERSEWRGLTVSTIALRTPDVVIRPVLRAPGDVRAVIRLESHPHRHWQVEVTWRDNSHNEDGFYVAFRQEGSLGGGLRIRQPRDASSLSANMPWEFFQCDRLYVVSVTAFNAAGESAPATATHRTRPCP